MTLPHENIEITALTPLIWHQKVRGFDMLNTRLLLGSRLNLLQKIIFET